MRTSNFGVCHIDNLNPYASPQTDVARQTLAEDDFEPIAFEGVVNRATLRRALQLRISWPNLAILFVVAFICLAASPSGFLNPLRPSKLRDNVLQEILGLCGIAFLFLGLWHLIATMTDWSLSRRESSVTKDRAAFYDTPIKGTLHKEFVHFDQPEGQTWTSYQSVIHCQLGEEIVLMDWGDDSAGSTVLAQNMFASDDLFRRAQSHLMAAVNHSKYYQRLQSMPDFFENSLYRMRRAEDQSPVVAQTIYRMTNRTGRRQIIRQIPGAVFRAYTPVHVFFGVVLAAALVFPQHNRICSLLTIVVWLSLMSITMLISLFQHRHLALRPNDILLSLKTEVTENYLYFQSKTVASVVPLSEFHIEKVEFDRVQYRIGDSMSTFERSMYDTEDAWQAMADLLLGVRERQSHQNTPNTDR